MGRACCVRECRSGKNVPSHRFPKNPVQRMKWLNSLNIKVTNTSEIEKLRVCHKHFRDSDYSCAPKLRVLLASTIPSIHVLEDNETVLQESVPEQQKNKSIPEEGELALVPKQSENSNRNTTEDITSSKKLDTSEMQELQTKGRENSLYKQQYNQLRTQVQFLMEQQETTAMLTKQQAEQQREINELKQKLATHELQCKKQMLHAGSGLKNTTRKILLSPQALLYERIIKLKRQQSYLKRLVHKFKISNGSKT